MPEELLGCGEPNDIKTVAYMCTGDRALQKVAQLCKIHVVYSMQPNRLAVPLMTADLSELIPITGKTILDEITKADREWTRERVLRFQNLKSDMPSGDDFKRIVQELEAEVEKFCEP